MENKKGGWLMKQTWEHLLFLHWQVPVEALKEKIPPQLELDTYNGKAWVGIIPFAINHMRVHGLPEIPFARSFLECNVRTYVTYNGEPGVYFFSLDADHAPAVTGARSLFHLPYFHADMKMDIDQETIHYRTKRVHKGTNGESLRMNYTPGGQIPVEKDSLTEWLTERYCLWAVKGNQVFKGDIAHEPWELYEADYTIQEQALWPGLSGKAAHQCYSPKQTAYIWRLNRMDKI
jgi:uncharacterized protein